MINREGQSTAAFSAEDHTWIICAYKESPYLEDCIRSLRNQTEKSGIRIATSTPNEHILSLARKYGLEVSVNGGPAGISGDWNFALSIGKTELLTIAHQDDLYEPEYTAEMLNRINRAKSPILYFTDYGELREGRKVQKNRLLRIKRFLLFPISLLPENRIARRCSLAFGNAICCPSITYCKSVIGENPFSDHFRSNLDWELTEKLSLRKGSFVYNPHLSMYHRIHEDSTTSGIIGEHQRTLEDYEMMKKFWPDWFAKRLSKLYAGAEKSNDVSSDR